MRNSEVKRQGQSLSKVWKTHLLS